MHKILCQRPGAPNIFWHEILKNSYKMNTLSIMKNYIPALVVLFSLFMAIACTNTDNDSASKPTTPGQTYVAPPIVRDYTIDSSNALNPNFSDSASMENYISEKNLSVSVAQSLRNFYNARNFQLAWYNDSGFTEHTRLFWNQYDYELAHNENFNRDFYDKFKELSSLEDSILVKDPDSTRFNNEMALTVQYIHFLSDMYGNDHLNEKMLQRFVPFKKSDPVQVADSLLAAQLAIDSGENKMPGNRMYRQLMKKLRVYDSLAYAGGYEPLSISGTLKKGATGASVLALKKRMAATGDYPSGDSSNVFNDSLDQYVRNYQSRMGDKVDGIVGRKMIEDLNVPIRDRIELLLINMNRMLWMPERPRGRMLEVNIPAFELVAREDTATPLRMNVVVGSEAYRTKVFNGDISKIVFAPYWNIPKSIVMREILPKMKRDKNYLTRNNMEIVQQGDTPIIRQKPGPDNSLGTVKFLFPNTFDIYLHDSPAKEAFTADNRAVSHGCIRVKEPVALANYVLEGQSGWDSTKIEAAMNESNEKPVDVEDRLPVFITYYTAWVDDQDGLHFRNDIYGHDKLLREKMFTEGDLATLPRTPSQSAADTLSQP